MVFLTSLNEKRIIKSNADFRLQLIFPLLNSLIDLPTITIKY